MAARQKRKKQSKAAHRARQKASSPSVRIEEAVDAFTQGKFDVAESLADNVIARTNAVELTKKARQILVESAFRQAATAPHMSARLDFLDRALKQNPDDARLRYHRGLTLWRLGKIAEAQKEFDLVAQRDPMRTGVALLQQLARAAQGGSTNAAKLGPAEANTLQVAEKFTSDLPATQIEPLLNQPLLGNQDATLWRALLEMRDKPKSAPMNSFASSNGQGPTSAVISYYRGVVALRQGEYQPALDAWRTLARSGFARPWFQENRFGLLRERAVEMAGEKRWQEILDLTAEQMDAQDDKVLNETVAAAHFHLGYAAAQKGNWEQATFHWRTANELNTSRYLAQNLALAEEALEEWQDAALAWREMVRRRPRKENHPDYLTDAQVSAIWAHAADCYAKAEAEEEWDYYPLYEEKLTCLKNAVKYAPNDLALRIRLVDAYREEDRDEAAQNELDRILEIDKDHVPALVRLGAIYQGQWGGDPIPLWERAIELEPSNTDARDALAAAILAQVRGEGPYAWFGSYRSMSTKERLEKLKDATKRIPNHPQILLELGIQSNKNRNPQDAIQFLRQSWEAAPNNARSVAAAMHELLHVEGGDKVVEEKLPSARQLSALRPMFWIAQGSSVLDCELDEQWAIRFWDEAVTLAERQRGPDTLVFTLVNIIETAVSEEVDHLAAKYEARLRADAPQSGGLEFIEAFKNFHQQQDTNKASRLLRTAQQKARKAGEDQLAEKAEQVLDMISGRMNPLLDLFGGMRGGPRGGPGGGPGGFPGGRNPLADLLDELDMDPEEFLDDFFKQFGGRR